MNWQAGLGMCLGLSLLQPLSLQAAKTNSPMTLTVCNKAGIDARILSAAEYRASGIFRRAGVDVQWIESGDCALLPQGTHITVVILSKAPLGWTSRDAMGF